MYGTCFDNIMYIWFALTRIYNKNNMLTGTLDWKPGKQLRAKRFNNECVLK